VSAKQIGNLFRQIKRLDKPESKFLILDPGCSMLDSEDLIIRIEYPVSRIQHHSNKG
jgi:hypothetical protein